VLTFFCLVSHRWQFFQATFPHKGNAAWHPSIFQRLLGTLITAEDHHLIREFFELMLKFPDVDIALLIADLSLEAALMVFQSCATAVRVSVF
jgi:hypothetical protein